MDNKLSKENKVVLGSCYYLFFASGMQAIMIGSLLPFMQENYGISYQVSGLIVSLHSVGNLISSFLGGILPVYIGRRRSMLMFCSIGILGYILMVSTGNPFILILASFMSGLNRGAISNYNNAVVNEVATGKAWALNVLHSVFALGAFSAPFVTLFFAGQMGQWRYAAFTVAFFTFIGLLLFTRVRVPEIKVQKKDGDVKSKTDYGFFKDKFFITATAILFTYLCAEQALIGWLTTYLKDSGIMSASFAQVMSSVLWIVILIGRLSVAAISGKVKKTRLLVVMGVGYIIFAGILITSTSSVPVTIGVVGIGLFMAGIYPTTVSCIGSVMKAYPMAWSYTLTIAGFGSILMPSVIGFVSETIGIAAGMSMVIIAVVITFLLICYNAWIWRKSEV